jgi:hypothetical protein
MVSWVDTLLTLTSNAGCSVSGVYTKLLLEKKIKLTTRGITNL